MSSAIGLPPSPADNEVGRVLSVDVSPSGRGLIQMPADQPAVKPWPLVVKA